MAEVDERERANFAKLTKEDEEFRRKILDLHRKLSDVDDGYRRSPETRRDRPVPVIERLRELDSVARRAEENFERNSLEDAVAEHKERTNALRIREILKREEPGRRKRQEVELGRKRYADLLWKSSEVQDEPESSSGPRVGFEETNFLKRLKMRKRGLLSFLGGRSSDRTQEERVSRILKIYFPEKETTKSQNTISIQHTSRDRRFWKLRNRRKSSSA